MNAYPRFKLSREAALALLVSSALPGAAVAQVARVQFATGQVSATGSDGKVRPLARGAGVAEGETVNTEQGRAQLQFVDGASVSLQPGTTFRIDEFRFSGKNDGQERGFFSLVRGGLRTITGLIGRDNRSAYRVTTSTATIGIRGTEYLADVTGSLRVAVGGGTIAIENRAGTFIIEQGQSAYIADQTSRPVITFEKPILRPASQAEVVTLLSALQGVVAGERTDIPPVVFLPEPPAPGTEGIVALALDVVGTSAPLFLTSGNAQINEAKQVTAFVDPSTGVSFEQGSTTVRNAFSDDVVSIGRWSEGMLQARTPDGAALSVPVGANQGLHYAFTTSPTLSMPTTAVATFTQVAATQATSSTGALGLGSFAPGQGAGQPFMTVDFATGKVGMDFSVNFSSAGYRVQTTGGLGGLAESEVSLLGVSAPFVFANTSPVPTMGIAGTACSGQVTCTSDVLGFFAGPDAERTGFTYKIRDPGLGVDVHGAVAGGKSETYAPLAASAVFAYADSSNFATTALGNGTAQVTPSGRVTLFSGTGCCEEPVTFAQGTAQFAVGESGYDGTIGFGRLTNGTVTVDGGEGGSGPSTLNLTANQGLHYVFGAPTNPVLASGIATYTLQGATKATSESGTMGLGTFSGSLAVDFALGQVGMAFNVNFGGGNVYSATSTGGTGNVRDSEVYLHSMGFSGNGLATANPTSCSSGCYTSVDGLFAGTNAARAGLSYRIFDYDRDDRVVGAATFAQSGFTPAPAGALVGAYISLSHAGAHDLATFGTSDAFKTLDTYGSIDSTGNLVAIQESSGYTTLGTASPVPGESGNDGIIGWSRWTNGTLGGYGDHANRTLSGIESFHNVFGTPTSASDMTALQTGNVTATYNLIGATKPTDAAGAMPGTLTSASLSANFGTGLVTFNAALSANAQSYNINATGLPISGSGFGGSASSVTGSGCACGCSGSVLGFFAGAMAARAGVAYNILNSSGSHVNGAAAFAKQ